MKKKAKGHIISRVEPGSIGEELSLEPGDRLLAVNGEEVEDIFDYEYYVESPSVTLLVEKASGKGIGSAGFTGATRGGFGPSDEIGYALHPDWWGRGLMTEAVAALLERGFRQRGLEAVWASHYAENIASRRVIEKSGFSPVCRETI